MVYPFAGPLSERGHGNLDKLRLVEIEDRTLWDSVSIIIRLRLCPSGI